MKMLCQRRQIDHALTVKSTIVTLLLGHIGMLNVHSTISSFLSKQNNEWVLPVSGFDMSSFNTQAYFSFSKHSVLQSLCF